MNITFDFNFLFNFLSDINRIFATQGVVGVFWYTFSHGAWIIYFWVLSSGFYSLWIMNKANKWYGSHKFVFLAIDIPKDTEQTPKAVEQLFATISGAHTPLNAREMYLDGMFQLHFSFEIVSIDGYIQFLIRTPEQWRDLIESAIYSQYPDAEITEVEDYTTEAPTNFPNETHNIWATEVVPDKHWVYPIKTYEAFEDQVSGEYKDSLAALLETMSKIHVGEQVWLQIQVKPTGFEWIKESMKEAYKIAGRKVPKKESALTGFLNSIYGFFFLSTGEPWFTTQQGEGSKSSSSKDDGMPSMMLHLTPGEKGSIEAVERKASKMGFECKIRLIYMSPLEDYKPARVVASVFGSIKQFNALDSNGFKPDAKTKTQIKYLFIKTRVNWRREKIMRAYKARSGASGANWFILNIEELATIWHFPSKFIKSPLLQKTDTKKSEAPYSLPIEQKGNEDVPVDDLRRQLLTPIARTNLQNKYYEENFPKKDTKAVKNKPAQKAEAPVNLPTGKL